MPQLDKVTFLSQFFWLCVFYLGFYYILLKHFLPRISRILALRKRKLNLSHQGIQSLHSENKTIKTSSDNILSNAFLTSKGTFENFFSQTNSWLQSTVNTVNKTHYQNINRSYLDSLGETSLSQNILLYHASKNIPTKLAIKFLLEKMKTLKNSSDESMRKLKKIK
jgi:F-type H+-transporting ATPase subunit b